MEEFRKMFKNLRNNLNVTLKIYKFNKNYLKILFFFVLEKVLKKSLKVKLEIIFLIKKFTKRSLNNNN